MLFLRDIFARCARAPDVAAGQVSRSDTDSEVGGADHFTLEMRDNPLQRFMRQVEKLADSDPAEAFRMAKFALSDRAFGPAAAGRLEAKVADLADRLEREKQALGPVFAVSALGLDRVKRPADYPFISRAFVLNHTP